MSRLIVSVAYSGAESISAPEGCIITKMGNENPCGNDNLDLLNYIINFIYGINFDSENIEIYKSKLYIQDISGKGYAVSVEKGEINLEYRKTIKKQIIVHITPEKIKEGFFKIEDKDGFFINKIYDFGVVGSVFDTNGISCRKPSISIDGLKIIIDKKEKIYAALIVSYEILCDVAEITYDYSEYIGADRFKLIVSFESECYIEPIQIDVVPCISSTGISSSTGGKELIKETANNTESVYDYCTRKKIWSNNPNAPEYLGVSDGQCG